MSEIRRARVAFNTLVAKVGMDNVPIANEKLRPLLTVMRNVAARHASAVSVLKLGRSISNKLPDRLQLGLIVRRAKYPTYTRELDEAISDDLVRAIRAHGKRVIAERTGLVVMIYHEDLAIPSAVLLPERRH